MRDFGNEYDSLETLRQVHPAWRLLAADHAPFIIGFLNQAFIAPNLRSLSEQELLTRLEDHLFHLRERKGGDAFKRSAKEYVDEWSSNGRAWLRKYYPPEGDEPQGLDPRRGTGPGKISPLFSSPIPPSPSRKSPSPTGS